MAPFGASCVLLFAVPGSPLSQPASVIGGHIVSTAIGLALRALLLMEWWSMGLAVGLAIAAMAALRVRIRQRALTPWWCCLTIRDGGYIGLPVAVGSLMLVMIAWLYHRLPPRITYPTPEQE